MFPFVFPWRAHYLLCILPIQFLTVCFLLSSGLHSNYHGNYITHSIIVFVSHACTWHNTQYYCTCITCLHNTTHSIIVFVSPACTWHNTKYYCICATCLHMTQHKILLYLCHLPAHDTTHNIIVFVPPACTWHNTQYYCICVTCLHMTQHTILLYLCHLPAHDTTHDITVYVSPACTWHNIQQIPLVLVEDLIAGMVGILLVVVSQICIGDLCFIKFFASDKFNPSAPNCHWPLCTALNECNSR